jgi:DNA-binding MarR family transcriptional regulator
MYPRAMADATEDQIDRIIAEWRRERPELNTEPMETFGRVFRAAQLADAALAGQLAVHGLEPGWFDLLAALRRAGPPYQLNPTALRDATMLSSGGMTKRLDRMTEAGLIERRPDRADRRGTLVRLTRKGRAAVDKAVETHLANEKRLLAGLSRNDRRVLNDLLRRLLGGLEQPG